MFNAIHVTHDLVDRTGGIGAVLEGLINSRSYRDSVGRTVLVCPLPHPENTHPLGREGVIEYDAQRHVHQGPAPAAFEEIERRFGVRIVYGRRPIQEPTFGRRTMCEMVALDLRHADPQRVNELKWLLWRHFGICSDRYEHAWEYEQFVRLAGPAAALVEVMQVGTDPAPAAVFAHEVMGLPTALALQAHRPTRYRTVFYAHEVAPVRRVIETQPGHDVMFYNALRAARQRGVYFDQLYDAQEDFHKTPLVRASYHCDGILAVGHHVQQELLFLGADFDAAEITLAYNGVPTEPVTLDQRRASRDGLRDYVQTLLGWRPDYVFTHVTRLTESKALWRDIDVLLALEEALAQRGATAAMLTLATERSRRLIGDVLRMEREWDWPLSHREGPPDLTELESRFYQQVQAFNARARHIKMVHVNQYGFGRASCGLRVPENVDLRDLRRGSDLELCLSLYEPFGLSPLEPLTYGGLSLISTSCGCAGFVKQISRGGKSPNVILADYVGAGPEVADLKDALAIGLNERREIERRLAGELAAQILKRLPGDEAAEEKLLRSGRELARRMSWDVVAERFVMPAVRRTFARRRGLSVVA